MINCKIRGHLYNHRQPYFFNMTKHNEIALILVYTVIAQRAELYSSPTHCHNFHCHSKAKAANKAEKRNEKGKVDPKKRKKKSRFCDMAKLLLCLVTWQSFYCDLLAFHLLCGLCTAACPLG